MGSLELCVVCCYLVSQPGHNGRIFRQQLQPVHLMWDEITYIAFLLLKAIVCFKEKNFVYPASVFFPLF